MRCGKPLRARVVPGVTPSNRSIPSPCRYGMSVVRLRGGFFWTTCGSSRRMAIAPPRTGTTLDSRAGCASRVPGGAWRPRSCPRVRMTSTCYSRCCWGVPAYTRVFGDKGVIDLEQQPPLQDAWGMLVKTPLRHNRTDRMACRLHPLARRLRQLIETVNGQLVGRLQAQRMRVRKGWTLAAKGYRKFLLHTICVFTNLQYGTTPTPLEALV